MFSAYAHQAAGEADGGAAGDPGGLRPAGEGHARYRPGLSDSVSNHHFKKLVGCKMFSKFEKIKGRKGKKSKENMGKSLFVVFLLPEMADDSTYITIQEPSTE